MLAIELGRRSIPVIVLEERAAAGRFPAANATQARTMEHYRRLGFAEQVRSAHEVIEYAFRLGVSLPLTA